MLSRETAAFFVFIIKSGSSFDFVAENRLFTGSDSYTLNIEFPLKGCPQNTAIFGHIHIADVEQKAVVFDCELRDGSFSKTGIVTITEINETIVKTQFLEGRSALNYQSSFDDIYINELSLGYPSTSVSAYNGIPYGMDESPVEDDPDCCTANVENGKYVALPWVNNNSGNVQNDIIPNRAGLLYSNCKAYSFQPYLRYLVELILDKLGYSYDFSAWKATVYNNIIVCNALPAAWDIYNFARALPHWTVTEFFEQLERFLPIEFDINHKTKSVGFAFSGQVVSNIAPVHLTRVIDDYTVEKTSEDESEYKFSTNIQYSDCSHRMWKFYSCQWFIDERHYDVRRYESYDKLLSAISSLKEFCSTDTTPLLNLIFHVTDIDTYFILEIISRKKETYLNGLIQTKRYRYTTRLVPINMFGSVTYNKESDDFTELGFVPAWIDETDLGDVIFLECNEYNETLDDEEDIQDDDYLSTRQTSPVNTLTDGEQTEKAEYYDKIYFAYWQKTRINTNQYYRPIVDYITMKSDGWSFYTDQMANFRLNQEFGIRSSNPAELVPNYTIDTLRKYTFKFISSSLPNPRAVFYIRGGKYLCKKLTATFREAGMSQLIKGEFYRITD